MRNLIIIICSVVVLTGGIWGFQYFTAPIRGKVEMQEQVQSGNNRRYTYNHFHDMYAKIKSYTKKIETQKNLLETTKDSDHKQRIRQNIAGLKSQRSDLVEQYNSDARKVKTKGQFRDKDLPEKITSEDFKSFK